MKSAGEVSKNKMPPLNHVRAEMGKAGKDSAIQSLPACSPPAPEPGSSSRSLFSRLPFGPWGPGWRVRDWSSFRLSQAAGSTYQTCWPVGNRCISAAPTGSDSTVLLLWCLHFYKMASRAGQRQQITDN